MARLHNRIKEAAYTRFKSDESCDDHPASLFPKELHSLPCMKHKFMARSQVFSSARPKPAGARKKYQDMLQAQQLASVCLEDYQMSRDVLKSAQQARLETLGNCSRLLRELSNPLPLEDAAIALSIDESTDHATSGSISSLSRQIRDVPLVGLRNAVETHLRTTDALNAITNSSQGERNVVNAPYDVTGPPVDVNSLKSVQSETLLQHLSADHFRTLEDKEESLLWVSYAAKAYSPQRVSGDAVDDNMIRNESKRQFDYVDADDLLKRVYADLMTAPERKQLLAQLCEKENSRINRLAKALRDDVSARISGKDLLEKIASQDESEKRRKVKACVRIQAFIRGVQSREIMKVKRAEQRVMQALGVLLNELALPELQHRKIDSSNLVSKLRGVAQNKKRPISRNEHPVQFAAEYSRNENASPKNPISPRLKEDFEAKELLSSKVAEGKDTSHRDSAFHKSGILLEQTLDTSSDPLSYISSPTAEGSSYELSSSLEPSMLHHQMKMRRSS